MTFENFAVINNDTQLERLLRRGRGSQEEREDGVNVEPSRNRSSFRTGLSQRPPTTVNSAVEPGGLATSTRIVGDGRAAVSTRTVIECRPAASGR